MFILSVVCVPISKEEFWLLNNSLFNIRGSLYGLAHSLFLSHSNLTQCFLVWCIRSTTINTPLWITIQIFIQWWKEMRSSCIFGVENELTHTKIAYMIQLIQWHWHGKSAIFFIISAFTSFIKIHVITNFRQISGFKRWWNYYWVC